MLSLFYLLSQGIVIVSFGLALLLTILFQHLRTPLKIISVYLIIGGCIELTSSLLASNEVNNLFFLHFFTFFEIGTMSYLFHNLYKTKDKRQIVIGILIVSLILMFINSIFVQGLEIYNSYSSTLVSILIIAYSLYYFYLNLDKDDEDEQAKVLKWSVICIFIYHCTSVIVMYFSNLLLGFSEDIQVAIWGIRILVILLTKMVLLYFFTRLSIIIYREQNHV